MIRTVSIGTYDIYCMWVYKYVIAQDKNYRLSKLSTHVKEMFV